MTPRTRPHAKLHFALLAAILIALSAGGYGLVGCGLSGGSIPPGPIGEIPGPPNSRSFGISGRVQQATPPYNPVPGSTVVVQTVSGQNLAGPVQVGSDGGFDFQNLPSSQPLTLAVRSAQSSLRPVTLTFESEGQPVQFVVAEPPVSSLLGNSIALQSTSTTIGVNQTLQIQATLGAATPDLGPSWIAFGTTGSLSALGPVATFTATSAGTSTIAAISDGAVASTVVTSTVIVPTSTGGGGSSGSTSASSTGSTGTNIPPLGSPPPPPPPVPVLRGGSPPQLTRPGEPTFP